MKASGVVGLVFLFAVGTVTPGAANWFANPYLGINRNIGSAPNPTPEQIRQERLGQHGLLAYGEGTEIQNPSPSATSDAGSYFQNYQQRRADLTVKADTEANNSMTICGPFGAF